MSEELKIIMDTIGQLGQAGKEAFIWWLVVKYAMHYATVLIFVCVAGLTIHAVVKRLTNMSHGNQLGSELARLLSVQGSGPYDGGGWDSEYQRPRIKAEILNRVREMMKKENA